MIGLWSQLVRAWGVKGGSVLPKMAGPCPPSLKAKGGDPPVVNLSQGLTTNEQYDI